MSYWKVLKKMRPVIEYKEEYCQLLIDHYRQGCSFDSFGAVVGCGKSTLYKWLDEYPEFKNAREEGECLDMRECEILLRAHVRGTKTEQFNPKIASLTALIFKMKTRYWRTYGDLQKHEILNAESSIIQLKYSIDDSNN